MTYDDDFHRWNDVKTLPARTDAGDKIVRRIATETGAAPVLHLPFAIEHFFEIDFVSVRRRAIVPPA